jgi:hypothetical protein
MRTKLYLAVIIFLTGTCVGQTQFPRKDLAFGQVVAGDTIETQVTVTNSGPFTYEGTLFFRRDDGRTWNPLVNGQSISGGRLQISVPPGETRTFRITGSGLQAGSLMLFAEDLILDNFIEGNLTYFFKNGSQITDSVGLGSATEFYVATLPFENFADVGLALANGDVVFESGDLQPRTDANVVMRLYRDNGDFVAASNDPFLSPLVPMAHTAKFLPEFFPGGTQLGRGKVVITSDVPIFGAALTFLFVQSGTQSSSLPLEATPVPYFVRMDSDNMDTLEGDLAIWAEGFFVKGYLVINFVNQVAVEDPALTLVNGQLIDGQLELSFYAQGEAFGFFEPGEEVSLVLEVLSGFDFEADLFNGPWVMTSLIDPASTLAGSFVIEK